MVDKVKKILLVLSGKGGVGKSTTAVQLALALNQLEKKVGILDLDLCGPSVAMMFDLHSAQIYRNERGWIPVMSKDERPISIMSIAFMLKDKNSAIIWRGPKKTSMIKQMIDDVDWGELDYLIIDTPPGTSDEHISVVEFLRHRIHEDAAILVTTPQTLSVNDVRRELTFCRKANLPIMGIIENMSGFQCPHCLHCTNIFSSGGGKSLAEMVQVPFLGAIPIDTDLAESTDIGRDFIRQFIDSPACQALKKVADNIIESSQK